MLLCLFLLVLQPKTTKPTQGAKFSCKTYGHIGKREIVFLLNATCTDIHGHLWLLSDEISYEQAEKAFSSVVNVYGCVSIRSTKYPDLAFFRNLETVTCAQNQVQAVAMKESFVVENNSQMKALGLQKISSVVGPPETSHYVNNNHKALCITENEKKAIGLLPDVILRGCSEPAVCFESASNKTDGSQLPENCSRIAWNIVLDGAIDQKYKKRLEQLQVLIGNLTIRNNKELKTLDLSNIQLIKTSAVKEDYAIVVENCPKLNLIQLNGNLTIQGACKSVKVDRMTSPDVIFNPLQNENDCYNHDFD